MKSGYPAAVEQTPFLLQRDPGNIPSIIFKAVHRMLDQISTEKQVIDGLKIWFRGYCKEYVQAHGARSARLV